MIVTTKHWSGVMRQRVSLIRLSFSIFHLNNGPVFISALIPRADSQKRNKAAKIKAAWSESSHRPFASKSTLSSNFLDE